MFSGGIREAVLEKEDAGGRSTSYRLVEWVGG
jgi:hypothetical protein